MSEKTTTIRLFTWVYWLITLFLFLIYSCTALFYSLYSFTKIDGFMASGKTQGIAVMLLLGLTVSIVILFIPLISKKESITAWLLPMRIPLTAVLACFLVFLVQDIKPVSPDYTEKDIISSTPGTAESFSAIKPLISDPAKPYDLDRKIWLSHDFLSSPETHETDIMNAWNSISDKRNIIDKLNTFETVSDVDPTQKIKNDMETIRVMPVLNMQAIYVAYAALKIKKGEPDEGLENLFKLYSVARKEAASSCLLLHKMLWNGVAGKTIEGAFLLSTMDGTTSEMKKKYAAHFTPLTNAETSLKKPIIGEYLFLKNTLSQNITPSTLLSVFEISINSDKQSLLKKTFSSLIYYIAFQKNRTIALNKLYFDQLIADVESSPPSVTQAKKINEYILRNPTVRNLAGWIFSRITLPDYTAALDKMIQIRIRSDLFSIFLHDATGEPVVLTDPYTGKPYNLKRDGNNLIAPGRDGVLGTADDVQLSPVKK